MNQEHNLGPVGQIPLGEGREFAVEGRRIAVFRPRLPRETDGAVRPLYATQASCPHREGPLADGLLGGNVLICPYHSWKFDLGTGRPLLGECSLTTYPVRQNEADEIVVTV